MTRHAFDPEKPGRKPRAKTPSDRRLVLSITAAERANYKPLAGKAPMSKWARDQLNNAARRGKRARGKQHARLVTKLDAITDEAALSAIEAVVDAVTAPDEDDDDDREGDSR